MKSMFPYKLRIAAVLTLLAVFVFANETVNAQKKAAQSKKAASAKVPDKKSATAKKTDKKSKDASKTRKADKNDK